MSKSGMVQLKVEGEGAKPAWRTALARLSVLAMLALAAAFALGDAPAGVADEPNRQPVAAGPAALGAPAPLDDDFPQVQLPDAISGKTVALADARGARATVLLCLAGDCPISNEYLPTIREIALAYRDRGVAFLGINPNGGQTLEIMAEDARNSKIPFPYLKDAGGKVSRRLFFSVTPEARVFDATGRLVYSGRIDDRYRRGGTSDPQVAKDLQRALDELLAGKPVSASRTRPTGCPLQTAEPAPAR